MGFASWNASNARKSTRQRRPYLHQIAQSQPQDHAENPGIMQRRIQADAHLLCLLPSIILEHAKEITLLGATKLLNGTSCNILRNRWDKVLNALTRNARYPVKTSASAPLSKAKSVRQQDYPRTNIILQPRELSRQSASAAR